MCHFRTSRRLLNRLLLLEACSRYVFDVYCLRHLSIDSIHLVFYSESHPNLLSGAPPLLSQASIQ